MLGLLRLLLLLVLLLLPLWVTMLLFEDRIITKALAF